MVRLRLTAGPSEDLFPLFIIWSDNYFTLTPANPTYEVSFEVESGAFHDRIPYLHIECHNCINKTSEQPPEAIQMMQLKNT